MIEHFLFWEGVDLKTRNRARGYSRCISYQHAIRCLNSVKDHYKTLNCKIIQGTMKFENDSQQENFNPNFPIKSSVCQRGKECKRFKSRMTLIVGHRRQHERVLQRECEAISTLQDIAERLECIPGIECNELAIWARKKWIEANEMREAEEFSKRSKRAIIERKREMGETIDFDG